MKKLIIINDEDVRPLNILAASKGISLIQYIKNLLSKEAKKVNKIDI